MRSMFVFTFSSPYNPGVLANLALELGYRRDDLPAHNFDWRNSIVVHHSTDDHLYAHRGESAQLVDQRRYVFTSFAHVEPPGASLENRVIVTPLCLAQLPQAIERFRNVRSGLNVAGVRVPRDQWQGSTRSAAGNQNGWMRFGKTLREIERPFESHLFARIGLFIPAFTLPHAQADLHRVLQ